MLELNMQNESLKNLSKFVAEIQDTVSGHTYIFRTLIWRCLVYKIVVIGTSIAKKTDELMSKG